MKTEIDRFSNKIIKTDTCWLWIGSKYRYGYGHFRRKINGKWKMYKAHRFSYEYYNGEIPYNSFVCHHCDNPSCVNPGHLFTGSAKDNHWDMRNKNKWKLGRNPKHKLLSLDIAREIRKYRAHYPEITQVEIAKVFSISTQQTSRILKNQIWQEVL